MKSNASLIYSLFLVVGDALALVAAFVVAFILRSHFTKVMVGFAMAARTVLRVALHCFNSVVVHAVAGGAFYFAVKKTLAAAKQFDLVAMNIYPRRIPVRVKRLATVEIGQGITGFKIKDGLRHDLCITPVALRTKVDSLLP